MYIYISSDLKCHIGPLGLGSDDLVICSLYIVRERSIPLKEIIYSY